MSYQVIARKWRPQAFEEVTGQDHITRTLRNAIEHGRLHHAYVFSGARGVGKTTTARLFAKALNCHRSDKPNVKPCKYGDQDICPSCLEISESRSMDVLEFDAASNTQVEKIREIILENINIGPARDRFKIFIIDEVHMLTTSSFNALLKTVEEPPPNVVFLMATTELHKIPDTITSRSQEFVFRTIPQPQIFDRLRLIADAEKVAIDDAALQIVARSGAGSMRDAQSNLDQVISFSGENITVDDVTLALGIAGGEVLENLVRSLASGHSKTALDVVASLVDRGQDLRVFCREVLGILRDILVFKVSGGSPDLVSSSVLAPETIGSLAAEFSEADIVRFFHSLAETEGRLKEAVEGRYMLEIGLIKLIELGKLKPIEDLLARLDQLTSGSASLPAPSAKAASQTGHVSQPAVEEKKTLKSDPDPPKPSNSLPADPESRPPWLDAPPEMPPSSFDDPEPQSSVEPNVRDQPAVDETPASAANRTFIQALPVKLPPISAEALEHVDDKVLDGLYERRLELSGDDLLPMPNVESLVAQLFGSRSDAAIHTNGNGSAAAPQRAPINVSVPDFAAMDAAVELPTLSAEPTEEELIAFANAHPRTRKVMRMFRAKVLTVKKKEPELYGSNYRNRI